MGPQHPSTHGVLRIKLFLDGEVIIKAVPYPGVPAPGRREAVREAHLHPAHPHRRQARLRRTDDQRAGHQRGHRAAGGDRGAAAGPVVAHHPGRDAAHRVTPAVARHLHPRHRRHHRRRCQHHDVHLPRAGDDPRLLRGPHRRKPFHYSTHTVGGNRHDVPRGWATMVQGGDVAPSVGASRVRGGVHQQRDLPDADPQRRRHRSVPRAGAGADRPQPPGSGVGPRSAPRRTLPRLRRDRGPRRRRRSGRQLCELRSADGRSSRRACASCP